MKRDGRYTGAIAGIHSRRYIGFPKRDPNDRQPNRYAPHQGAKQRAKAAKRAMLPKQTPEA